VLGIANEYERGGRLEEARRLLDPLGGPDGWAGAAWLPPRRRDLGRSVAHLAGAMGRPVWIMLPRAPDQRWLLQRSDTPWYPTTRLFRQQTVRCWDDVV